MASGLPLVAPRSGGVLSYATPENSWLAAPTGDAFADAVRSVFADDAARAAKVANALTTAGEFSWARATAKFFELYDEIFLQLQPLSSSLPASHSSAPASPIQ
jgi:glycosyltransferase involved in cell wall biosynthesis